MLEGSIKVIHKLIVVVGVYKVVVVLGKNKSGAHMQFRQLCIMRVFDDKHIFGIVIKVFTLFVAEVGVCVSVAHNFTGFFNFYGAVIGGDNNAYIFLR